MAEKIRFYPDENVHPAVARALRKLGIDATTAVEERMRGTSDTEQLEFVLRTGRVLFTHDADFLRFAAQRLHHPGIVYCRRICLPSGRSFAGCH